MQRYVSKMVMTSIGLVIVSVILGMTFTLFTPIKEAVANAHRANENKAAYMVNDRYVAYNGTEVYGDAVYVAAVTFSSDNFAIVINNAHGTYGIGNVIKGSTMNSNGTYNVKLNTLDYKDGYYTAEFNGSEESTAKYNILKSAGSTYVDYRKMYKSELIRDKSYEVVGIVFKEQ